MRYGLLTEILTRDAYLLGRSVLNMSTGIMQICGFAAGACWCPPPCTWARRSRPGSG